MSRDSEAVAERLRRWRQANRGRYNESQRRYRSENRDYVLEQKRRYRAAVQGESLAPGPRWRRWEPFEDALLARVPSNIAAASALGRTFHAIENRRRRLRAKGVLA